LSGQSARSSFWHSCPISIVFLFIFSFQSQGLAQETNTQNQIFQENFSDILPDSQAISGFESHFSNDLKMSPSDLPRETGEDSLFISPFLEKKIEDAAESYIENFTAQSPNTEKKAQEPLELHPEIPLTVPEVIPNFEPESPQKEPLVLVPLEPLLIPPEPRKRAPLKKIISKMKIPTIEQLLNTGDLDQVIVEQGIERSDRIASYLLLEAKTALDRGKDKKALKLGEMAASVSPLSPIPSFFMAKAIWQTQPFNLISILAHYMTGLRLLFGDFLFMIPILSPMLLLLLLAIVFSMLTFILYSLFSYVSIWVHQMTEVSRGYLHFIPASLIFALLFFMPLLLGFPVLWFFFFAFIFFWGFYTRLEKMLVFGFIAILGTSTWMLPFLLTLFTANGSLLLNEMSRNHHSDFLWTPPPLELKNAGWEGLFIRASYESQRRNYQTAAGYYKNALETEQNSSKILNNLGNLSYYSKDYDQAILYYQQAIEAEPSLVSAYYNLSQTYREMLLFEKGDALFEKATQISTHKTENYAMKSEHYPDYPVIEERFTKADLWNRLLNEKGSEVGFDQRIWQGMLGNISLSNAPFISISWMFVLSLSGFLYAKFLGGKQCAFCKIAVCRRCVKRLFSYQVCRPCEMRFMTVRRKSDFASVENAIKKVPPWMYPIFLIPGGGHLVIKKTKTGFFLLVLFFLALSTIIFGESLVPPTEWYLHRTGSLFPKIGVFLIYFVAVLDLSLKRSANKWL